MKGSNVTLVDFFATWCGPCKMMAPVLDRLSEELPEGYAIVKVDIDENMELAQKYRIQAVPTMVIFKDGQPVETVVGAVRPETLKEKMLKN